MARSPRAPWSKANPRKRAGKASTRLTSAEKATAKARARRAGRPYPNLVDNMRVAAKKAGKTKTSGRKRSAAKANTKKATTKKVASKKAARKTARSKTRAASSAKKRSAKRATPRKATSRKSAKSKREKDPRGGLTAAGRQAFAERDGAHLRPGVTKKVSEMTPQDMRRKGSWAVRFYGRDPLPPLLDAKGRPTRLALSAHAWGEPVPRTVAAARKIAAKGERLLARYHRIKDSRTRGKS
ncbi:conserved protein of unknown function [Bradyrhizobium sp. ORS 285]|uniref:DUF6321 domain-containing protein n=1 Tax=Bradyrhizobium sp. ORS 285 TaxID=115808 RepID=UPI000240615B|nr:DUF6321 domain-containing protein [Bradyrhizobium sp. ORS 285]CCD84823.1 conserved hypothetical protein [Bradyrhizobium sp. ORS 285]SMX57367.1 conserved protein of unknown function [Bradyrhizobium sp. ORS 285]